MVKSRFANVVVVVTLALMVCGCMTGVANMPKEQKLKAVSKTIVAEAAPNANETELKSDANEGEEDMLHLSIGDTEVSVEWENNESVEALAELVADEPLCVRMSRYGSFEQVGPLGTTLPSSDVEITTAAGDIVLYAGNQIVVFYGSNSWAYTRLGHIIDRTADEMGDLLGDEDVVMTISAQ